MAVLKEFHMANENAVKSKIRRVCSELPMLLHSVPAGEYSTGGIADFLACVNGRYVAIEAKWDKNCNTSALQARFLRNVLNNGGYVAVVDKDNVSGLRDWLLGIAKGTPSSAHYVRKPRDLNGPAQRKITLGE